MFKPVKAKSIEEYLDNLPLERQEPVQFLHKFIQEKAPSLKPHFAYNMIGYGSFKYKNSKKELADWPVISLASQKNYTSIYVCSIKDGKYVAEKYKAKLGKVSVGKSCIRIKNIEDVNLPGLESILKLAEKSPGLDVKAG